ncbi:DUF5791 family protein [Halospeciosus flavus]|uniref:DUF5791 family protein n=1 Tax=Halospeciosus flavus TaxID=3032283 RepID=A0ABD5Z6G2_9EURY|nr:DUF5791 family protein [Halospeciosus flavus]
MFTEEIAEPEAVSPAEVRAEYEATLEAIIDAYGVDAAADETDFDADRLAAIRDGDAEAITTEEAAEVLALAEDWPPAEDLLLEMQDHVMLQMSSAVVDVDSLATDVEFEDDLSAKEIQQRIEGRHPMTLDEYARIHHYLASENPW